MKFFLVLAVCSAAFAAKARYDNYKVVSLIVETAEQNSAVMELEKMGYLYMDPPQKYNQKVDVIVPPHKFAEIDEIITNLKFKSKTVLNNLQETIESQTAKSRSQGMDWTSYHRLETIYDWLDDLKAKYPEQVTLLNIGESYEKRPIRGVKISFKQGNNQGIFLESNIHAREWISSAVSTWIVNQLLTSTDPVVQNLAQTIDWYVIPVTNPDGFAYTHRWNRLWRKTRRPNNSWLNCIGTDANRNFDYFWKTGGSSSNGCFDTYAGSSAFSEPETKALSDFYNTIANNITAYIDFHSYSQLLMYPYGAKKAGDISNEDEHIIVGTAMQKALAKRYDTKYRFGNIVTTIYEASGGSIDWIKGVHDTPFVYVYELRDTGKHGFLLPANQIIPNAEEVLDSFVVLVEEARKLGYFPQ